MVLTSALPFCSDVANACVFELFVTSFYHNGAFVQVILYVVNR